MIYTGAGPLAQAGIRSYYEVATLSTMHQWWHWLALVSVCAAIVTFVVLLYRRDTVEYGHPHVGDY